MTLEEAISSRHSVRQYQNKPLEAEIIAELQAEIDACNATSGMNIQLVTNEPKAFDSFIAHYGKFSGVTSYIALIGKNDSELDEKCGYFGERLALRAQQLGLNSCWVAMSYQKIKSAYVVGNGEKLCLVIALGYGKTQGVAHKSKTPAEVVKTDVGMPDWFKKGVEAALLAPTAMNQQKFSFALSGNKVTVKAGMGFYAKVDLGIVKYHFEIGAGKENFCWA